MNEKTRQEAYPTIKKAEGDWSKLLNLIAAKIDSGDLVQAVALAEMSLVREFDGWSGGKTLPNVKKAIDRFSDKVLFSDPLDDNLAQIAGLLAWLYARLEVKDDYSTKLCTTISKSHRRFTDPDKKKLIGLMASKIKVHDNARELAYKEIKAQKDNWTKIRKKIEQEVENNHIELAIALAEMSLVRVYDDWYIGSPDANIKKSISKYSAAVVSNKYVDENINRIASTLAWLYSSNRLPSRHATELCWPGAIHLFPPHNLINFGMPSHITPIRTISTAR